MALSKEDIRKIVRELVAERFDATRVVSVDVEEDIDPDGDPVLHVTVVYDTESGRLDPSRLAGLVRRLRPRLLEEEEARFPLMSFISRADVQGTHPEAA